jgi:hypothetical protein
MKHTPGPWYHDFASAMKNGSPQVVEYFVRRDGDNVSIAADIVNPETCAPSEYNARLIAAAPDLLEALQDLLHQAEQSKEPWWDYEQARAAISKALGNDG